MAFYTYILTNQRNGALYIGSTDDLARRIWYTSRRYGPASPPVRDIPPRLVQVSLGRAKAFHRERS